VQPALLEELLQQVAYALVVVDDQYVCIGFHWNPVICWPSNPFADHPHDRIRATSWPVAAIGAAAGFPRNNPETKFYNREKLVKDLKAITGAVAVSDGCDASFRSNGQDQCRGSGSA
jgi:hypothetical protein